VAGRTLLVQHVAEGHPVVRNVLAGELPLVPVPPSASPISGARSFARTSGAAVTAYFLVYVFPLSQFHRSPSSFVTELK